MSKQATENRLGKLIQPKGTAPRPAEMPHGGIAPAAPIQPTVPRRSLSLKMEEADYQILRSLAFDEGKNHQDVMLEAVLNHFKAKGRK